MPELLKKEQINLKYWEFEAQQRAEQPILLCDWFCRAIATYFASEIGIDLKTYNYLFTDSSKLYNNPKQRQLTLQKLRQKIKNPAALKSILRRGIEIPRSFNAVADTLKPELKNKNIPNARLAEFWRQMDAGFIKVIPWFWYPWYISGENMLTDRIRARMQKYRRDIEKIADFEEALLQVIFPIKKTGFQSEQEALYRLVLLAKDNKNFENSTKFKHAATIYLRRYDWLTTFILTPLLPMTRPQLVRRVKEALRHGFKENFELQRRANIKNRKIVNRVLKLFKKDPALLRDIENARELGYVLTAGVEEAYIASSRYLTFMQLVAKRIGVKFQDIKFLLSEEIINALEKSESISPKVLDSRRNGFTMLVYGGKQYLAIGPTGHRISQWVDKNLNVVDRSIRELKGQVASKGFARGRARIAFEPSEAHALKAGEILICPMTNPDYVPAMRRCAAIITDEGGLLSHAAIMSRELGKPCVIATKIATKVIKTGDLIEVDANHGLIKLL